MTWQDELGRLDEELASGRISAEDYRRRRDELIAANSGDGPVASPTGQQPQGPFPPPFRWEASGIDSTQVIRPIPAEGQPSDESPDRTQVVPRASSAPSDATQVVPPRPRQEGADADRTQVVSGGMRQQPQGPSAFPPPPQGPAGGPMEWQQPAQDSTPPWGTSDLPPLGAGASWIKQGPEVFESDGNSNTGKIIGAVVAVVLLLGIATGAYFLFGQGPSSPSAQGPATTPPSQLTQTSASPTKPTDPLLAPLPGTAEDTSSIKKFTDVEGLHYLTNEETNTYNAGGAGTARIALNKDGQSSIIVLVVQESSPEAAITARDTLAELQSNYSLHPTTPQAGVRGATTDTAQGASPSLRRAHYSSGQYVVRVEVGGTNASEVDQLFQQVLKAQLGKLRADG